jgi:hypothetical protein
MKSGLTDIHKLGNDWNVLQHNSTRKFKCDHFITLKKKIKYEVNVRRAGTFLELRMTYFEQVFSTKSDV